MKIILLFLLTLSTLFAGIGEVTAVKGEAQLLRSEVSLAIDKGAIVEVKDLLQTEARSKVQVILHDETVITIGPKSKYLFEAYNDEQNPNAIMELQQGFFKVVTGKIGKIAPQRFKIKTKAATIGVRGTQFMASVHEDSEKIGCSRGALVVETEQTTFELPAGRMLVYENHVWTMYELDYSDFTPVLSRTAAPKQSPLKKETALMPDTQIDETIQGQMTDKPHFN